MVAAQKNVDAEKHGVRRARSSFMPDVTAEARINRVEDGVSFQGNGSIDEVSLVVNAEFPLFRGGRTVGEVKQALATRREAENNLHAARRLVQRELVDAFNNYQTVDNSLSLDTSYLLLNGIFVYFKCLYSSSQNGSM